MKRIKQKAKTFNRELKKSTNTAIVAAFSFLIALTWKDVITESVNKLTQLSPINGKIISALIITFVCVFGILLTTKLLKVKDGEKKQ